MEEFQTYEYTVRQRIEGKWIAARIGLVLLYILFVGAWILVALLTRILTPLLGILLPVTLGMLIFFTWRYVSVEYEYSITSGVLTFSRIFSRRFRKKVFEVPLREAVRIAPLGVMEEYARGTEYKPEISFFGISSLQAPDVYFMLFEHADKKGKEKRRAVYYFEATQKTLHLCHYYNPSATVMAKTSL